MRLVLELRASGARGEFEAVFTGMIDELKGLIDFIQAMWSGIH